MAKGMTKAAGRRRLKEISSKSFKLLGEGYISMKDYETIMRITSSRSKQLK
jgi:hypothetical protein